MKVIQIAIAQTQLGSLLYALRDDGKIFMQLGTGSWAEVPPVPIEDDSETARKKALHQDLLSQLDALNYDKNPVAYQQISRQVAALEEELGY